MVIIKIINEKVKTLLGIFFNEGNCKVDAIERVKSLIDGMNNKNQVIER